MVCKDTTLSQRPEGGVCGELKYQDVGLTETVRAPGLSSTKTRALRERDRGANAAAAALSVDSLLQCLTVSADKECSSQLS